MDMSVATSLNYLQEAASHSIPLSDRRLGSIPRDCAKKQKALSWA
jgi:hypothetical protein